jgi:hypothetical protein
MSFTVFLVVIDTIVILYIFYLNRQLRKVIKTKNKALDVLHSINEKLNDELIYEHKNEEVLIQIKQVLVNTFKELNK